MLASFSNSARLLALVAATVLTGCAEPQADLPGTWRPTGANEQNLRAMLVNPQDAYVGNAAQTTRGDSASRAVTRLLIDKRRSLLDAAVSHVGGGGSGGGDSGSSAGGSGQ